jgi:hypothetical protein
MKFVGKSVVQVQSQRLCLSAIVNIKHHVSTKIATTNNIMSITTLGAIPHLIERKLENNLAFSNTIKEYV